MTSTELNPVRSVFSDGYDWTSYVVELTFLDVLYGGAPRDPAIVEGWLKSNLGISDEEQLRAWTIKHLAEVQGLDPGTMPGDEEIERAVQEGAMEKKANGFKRTPEGRPYIEGRQIKAMLKENVNIAFPEGEHRWGSYKSRSAKSAGKMVGGKRPKDYLAERVWVVDSSVVVADDSDGYELVVGHIKDWRGNTRATLGYVEYAIQPVFEFTIEVLDDCITGEQWSRIMRSAERNGLGARRSQGGGVFRVTRWERGE